MGRFSARLGDHVAGNVDAVHGVAERGVEFDEAAGSKREIHDRGGRRQALQERFDYVLLALPPWVVNATFQVVLGDSALVTGASRIASASTRRFSGFALPTHEATLGEANRNFNRTRLKPRRPCESAGNKALAGCGRSAKPESVLPGGGGWPAEAGLLETGGFGG